MICSSSRVWLWFSMTVALCLCATASIARAATVAGVTLDDQISINNTQLVYNGAGLRKRLFFKLYVGSLYVSDDLKGGAGEDVINADEPMMIQLNILSDLLTRDKLVNALKDGLNKSTQGNTAPIEAETRIMLDALSGPVRPGHVYQLIYQPGTGTQLMLDGELLATAEGLPFKQALFGIWLSDAPAQASLKAAMLSGGS